VRCSWDREADVLVVGYGLAGAVSAVEAQAAGRRVVIVEKATHPGGLSVLSGGFIKCISSIDVAIQYLRLISSERVDQPLIEAFAAGLSENEEYLRDLCRINGSAVEKIPVTRERPYGTYAFPGQDAFYGIRVRSGPDFGGFPWVQSRSRAAQNLFKVAADQIEKRGIEVLHSTAAKRLVTDGNGVVVGLVAEAQGEEVAIRARRAVILATGGFEQNHWLKMQYLQGIPFYSAAPLTHTGDGILMSQKVGAALWHMWHVHGSYGFKFAEHPVAFRHVFGGPRLPNRIMPWIVVDKLGSRYMNEYHPAPQDTNHRPMELFDPDIVSYPRIPSFLIFDEEGRKRGPIAQPVAIGENAYEWSQDNLTEIGRGWILQGSTVRDLAKQIRKCPENEGFMEADRLEATIAEWNASANRGRDPLNRPPGTMMPIQSAPFYGVPVWPVISNTQGGPVHNTHQQVMDAFGQPVPGLYAVGELGSFFGHLYELSGNLSECLYSGRVAGRRAADEAAR
jgi:succinate dehydrogenase/fumarate reductase flavoprotein subunit